MQYIYIYIMNLSKR